VKLHSLKGVLSLLVAFSGALLLSAPAVGDVGTVSFSGAALGGQEITGAFTVDHFAVTTPLDYPAYLRPPQPHLVAVGTATGRSSFFSTPPPVVTVVPFDAGFAWVNLTVAAVCGDSATVTFGRITGLDYRGIGPIYGLPLWDTTVPLPIWNSDVHWGVTATDPLVLAGNPGLPCAIARAVAHGNLAVEATTLNALLRQQ
jgi:hypothetical protein